MQRRLRPLDRYDPDAAQPTAAAARRRRGGGEAGELAGSLDQSTRILPPDKGRRRGWVTASASLGLCVTVGGEPRTGDGD
jgi:hypothetical protein